MNAVKCRSMDLMKHGRDLRESIGYAMVDYLKFAILRGYKMQLKMVKVLRLVSKDDMIIPDHGI